MSFFATDKDYRRENVKTRPTKYIPKFKKKAKLPQCSQCENISVKVILLNNKDKRYLCQYHVILWEKRDYKVEKSYKHFKRANDI
jgi:hypothetical protein